MIQKKKQHESKPNEQHPDEVISSLKKEVAKWVQKYTKLEQVFRMQEEIIASYEAAYGEAPSSEKPVTANKVKQIKHKREPKKYETIKKMEKRAHHRFNAEQKAAIDYDMEKHLRIIAGAGSGKTQTICAKAALMIEEQQVPGERILMITFTRNAANELKKRVDNFLRYPSNVQIGTFHSVFQTLYNQLLKEFPRLREKAIPGRYSKENSQKIHYYLQQLIRKYSLYTFDQYGDKDIASRLDYWRNLDLSQEQIISFVQEKYNQIDKNSQQTISERMEQLLLDLEEKKQAEHWIEFNDMLQNLKKALEDPEIQGYVGRAYDYLIIDEFQDTNPLQWAIIQALTKNSTMKLIIVGDDDQSIYGFRGSEPKYLIQFNEVYETETLYLLTNYRSRAAIVHAANQLIAHNTNERIEKAMVPSRPERGKIEAHTFENPLQEAIWIIDTIDKLGHQNNRLKESIILYRSMAQAQQFIQLLIEKKIPFVMETATPYTGIFGIRLFRPFIKKLMQYLNSSTENQKFSCYQQILREIVFAVYFKKSEVEELLNVVTENNAKHIITAMQKIRPEIDKNEALVHLLVALESISQLISPDISPIVQAFLLLPKSAKEISQEDQDWILSEIHAGVTLKELMAYEKNLYQENQQMKARLVGYRQGKVDALCVQSIHKSKGLSYRNVFLLGCYEGAMPHRGAVDTLQVTRQPLALQLEATTTIEEERRLFYVAMTRARNCLFLTAPLKKGKHSVKISRFIRETGLTIKS